MRFEFSRSRNRWLPALAGLGILVAVTALAVAPASSETKSAAAPTRAETAHRVYDSVRAGFAAGQGNIDEVYTWSVHWLDAELAGASKAARKKAFAAHRSRMTDLRTTAVEMTQKGLLRASAPLKADYFVAEADAWHKARTR